MNMNINGPLHYIDVVFDGPPGPTAGRFVEVENELGASIKVGEWIKRADGFWVLRISNMHELIKKLGKALKDASEHLDYCGYGDNWESECALERGLDKDIEKAVRAYEEYYK